MTINTTDNPPQTPLERTLASLTAGPQRTEDEVISSGLWLKALEQSAPAGASPIPIWKRTILGPWLSAAAVLILFILTGAIMLPAMSKSRGVDSAVTSYSVPPLGSDGSGWANKTYEERKGASAPDNGVAWSAAPSEEAINNARAMRRTADPASQAPAPSAFMINGALPASPTPQAPVSSDRFVIRKVTLDLTTTDVRSTFAKAALVINEAVGEYIEASSLTGDGPTASATITLRVTTAHLSEAMIQLRKLAGTTVVAEQSGGQDVTDSVVDLDARLRNEQRIEREVLALIDKRPDAPLKDILEIRTQLEGIRARIEQLVGQRDRIGRMVSLATILVTVKPADAPKPVEKPAEKKDDTIGAYFQESIASAWHTSLVALADTAAFLIRTIVGGIVWWLLALLAATVVWKLSKRALAKGAAEPVPVG